MFISAWAVLGHGEPGYVPVEDAISRLAALGAPTRPPMTAALVTLGAGMSLYALARRSAMQGPSWVPAALNGLATWAVAGFPLASPSAPSGPAHDLAAGAAYLSLAALPAVAAVRLAPVRKAEALVSVLAATACASLLVASLGSRWSGLLQRSGLTVGHIWVMASAAALLRRRDA